MLLASGATTQTARQATYPQGWSEIGPMNLELWRPGCLHGHQPMRRIRCIHSSRLHSNAISEKTLNRFSPVVRLQWPESANCNAPSSLFLETAMPSHLDFWARAPQRRCPPFLRLPTTSRLLAWLLASTLAAPTVAQPAQGSNTPAPLHYPPLTQQSPQAPPQVAWAAPNRAGAALPRRHADIPNSEAHHAAATVAPPTPSPPAATTDGAPHPGMRHQMPQQMHDKGPHPMPHGHHTKQPTTPPGGRP